MPKTVSASDAKTRFGEMIAWAGENQDDVIIESRGRPKAVIISFKEYQNVLEQRERARREEILNQLEQLRSKVSSCNQDLSEEDALALGDRFTREVIDEMIAEGKIKYGKE